MKKLIFILSLFSATVFASETNGPILWGPGHSISLQSEICLSDGVTCTTIGASGGSQTPWISDIDGDGFDLGNVDAITVITSVQSPAYYFPGGDNITEIQVNFNQLGAGSPYTFYDSSATQAILQLGTFGTPSTFSGPLTAASLDAGSGIVNGTLTGDASGVTGYAPSFSVGNADNASNVTLSGVGGAILYNNSGNLGYDFVLTDGAGNWNFITSINDVDPAANWFIAASGDSTWQGGMFINGTVQLGGGPALSYTGFFMGSGTSISSLPLLTMESGGSMADDTSGGFAFTAPKVLVSGNLGATAIGDSFGSTVIGFNTTGYPIIMNSDGSSNFSGLATFINSINMFDSNINNIHGLNFVSGGSIFDDNSGGITINGNDSIDSAGNANFNSVNTGQYLLEGNSMVESLSSNTLTFLPNATHPFMMDGNSGNFTIYGALSADNATFYSNGNGDVTAASFTSLLFKGPLYVSTNAFIDTDGSGGIYFYTGGTQLAQMTNAGEFIFGSNAIIFDNTGQLTVSTAVNTPQLYLPTSATSINDNAAGMLIEDANNDVLIAIASSGFAMSFFGGTPVTQQSGDLLSAFGASNYNLVTSPTVLGRSAAIPAYMSFASNVTSIVSNQIASYGKATTAATIIGIQAVATSFTCVSNPVFTLYDCGTSAGACTSGRTALAAVTLTAANTGTDGTVSSSALAAGHYWAVESTGGTCTSLNINGTAQYN